MRFRYVAFGTSNLLMTLNVIEFAQTLLRKRLLMLASINYRVMHELALRVYSYNHKYRLND